MSKSIVKIYVFFLLLLSACTDSKQERAEALYQTNCSSCHIAPSPKDLPKHLWEESVLPEMAARMGIVDNGYEAYSKLPFSEQKAVLESGVYPIRPTISIVEWNMLKEYIINTAPDSLISDYETLVLKGIEGFDAKAVNVDSLPGSSISFLKVHPEKSSIDLADLQGNIFEYSHKENNLVKKNTYRSAITSYVETDSMNLVTLVGRLNPSEISSGGLIENRNTENRVLVNDLHRPVHTSSIDLDKDGNQEILVCEFGHLSGKLSLLIKEGNSYRKVVLLQQPGVIRAMTKDMNKDGKLDIIAMTTQGNEGVSILYQTEDLSFRTEQVIRFNPIYGSSWFDLVDYNGDGFDDIITVNGDNADKTYVPKPYHGLRIHINDGSNGFKEEFFYPLNGATRFSASDFDHDGDIDIAIIAAFPDYDTKPEYSFVYLENRDSKVYKFESYGLNAPAEGRWLLIDGEDIDGDGDMDIVLGSFTYYFTPVPDDLLQAWKESNVDLLILENQLIKIDGD